MNLDFKVIEIVSSEDGEDSSYCWKVPDQKELPYLEGHFPGFPVVPGFITIAVSLKCIDMRNGGEPSHIGELVSAKFMSPIEPGQIIKITLEYMQLAQLWECLWERQTGKDTAYITVSKILLRLQSD